MIYFNSQLKLKAPTHPLATSLATFEGAFDRVAATMLKWIILNCKIRNYNFNCLATIYFFDSITSCNLKVVLIVDEIQESQGFEIEM